MMMVTATPSGSPLSAAGSRWCGKELSRSWPCRRRPGHGLPGLTVVGRSSGWSTLCSAVMWDEHSETAPAVSAMVGSRPSAAGDEIEVIGWSGKRVQPAGWRHSAGQPRAVVGTPGVTSTGNAARCSPQLASDRLGRCASVLRPQHAAGCPVRRSHCHGTTRYRPRVVAGAAKGQAGRVQCEPGVPRSTKTRRG